MSARITNIVARAVAMALIVCVWPSASEIGYAQILPIGEEELTRLRASTYFGGLGAERCQGIWELASGDILVTGETSSNTFQAQFMDTVLAPPRFPTHANQPSAVPGVATDKDAYLAVLDKDLTQVKYWTYLGGVGQDRAYFAMDDVQGNIWVCGWTTSYGTFHESAGQYYFPTGHVPTSQGSADADVFVAKFNSTLSALLDCSVIGGTADESARGSMWVEGEFVYVSGGTTSTNFVRNVGPAPLAGASGGTFPHCSANLPKCDAFVVQFDRANAALLWSRIISGNVDDALWANVRVDANGDVFVAGHTNSSSFAFGAIDTVTSLTSYGPTGDFDGLVIKLVSSGALAGGIKGMCRIGGTQYDLVSANDCLELDAQGRPVVMGFTRSGGSVATAFPTTTHALSTQHSLTSPPNCSISSNDIFVAKLPNDLQSALIYATYVKRAGPTATLAATEREEPAGLALFGGSIYLTGETQSANMPVTGNAYDPTISTQVAACSTAEFRDSFLIKFFPGITGPSVLHFASFFGGNMRWQANCPGVPDENGTRGRCLSIGRAQPVNNNYGLVILSGVTSMTDHPSFPGSEGPAWIATDTTAGYASILNAGERP